MFHHVVVIIQFPPSLLQSFWGVIVLAIRFGTDPIVVPCFKAGFVVGIRSSREATLGVTFLLLAFTFTLTSRVLLALIWIRKKKS